MHHHHRPKEVYPKHLVRGKRKTVSQSTTMSFIDALTAESEKFRRDSFQTATAAVAGNNPSFLAFPHS